SSRDQSLYVTEFNDTLGLTALFPSGKPWKYQRLAMGNSLAAGQWNHVAVVTGRNGCKLYLNGALVGTNDSRVSLSDMGQNTRNLLGTCIGRTGQLPQKVDLLGAIDEFRIWNH